MGGEGVITVALLQPHRNFNEYERLEPRWEPPNKLDGVSRRKKIRCNDRKTSAFAFDGLIDRPLVATRLSYRT